MSRRAGAAVVASLFFLALFAGAHDAPFGEAGSSTVAVTGRQDPVSVPVVARATATGPLIAASRPIRQRNVGLDALAAAAAAFAVFGVFRRYAKPGAAQRFRFDAVFALRRGPPIFSPAL